MIKLGMESTGEDIEKILSFPVGTVFEMDFNVFEELAARIERIIPEGSTFNYGTINPGTDLYTIFGYNHCVILQNDLLVD